MGAAAAAAVERRTVCEIPAPGLLDAAEGADLLVVGARGQGGFGGLLLGSVSQQCLHHATGADRDGPRRGGRGESGAGRVVVGVDGSAGSAGALRWALADAAARGAVLEVVSAWEPATLLGPMIGTVPHDVDAIEAATVRMVDETVADARADVGPERAARHGPAGRPGRWAGDDPARHGRGGRHHRRGPPWSRWLPAPAARLGLRTRRPPRGRHRRRDPRRPADRVRGLITVTPARRRWRSAPRRRERSAVPGRSRPGRPTRRRARSAASCSMTPGGSSHAIIVERTGSTVSSWPSSSHELPPVLHPVTIVRSPSSANVIVGSVPGSTLRMLSPVATSTTFHVPGSRSSAS